MSTKKPTAFLSRSQVAERMNLPPDALSRYKLPPEDATIGPLGDYPTTGKLPRGTIRGWTEATIEEWIASRTRKSPGEH